MEKKLILTTTIFAALVLLAGLVWGAASSFRASQKPPGEQKQPAQISPPSQLQSTEKPNEEPVPEATFTISADCTTSPGSAQIAPGSTVSFKNISDHAYEIYFEGAEYLVGPDFEIFLPMPVRIGEYSFGCAVADSGILLVERAGTITISSEQ